MVLITALASESNDSEHAAFFGYMGLASALVFASTKIPLTPRPRRRLRNCQIRSWYLLHGRAQTPADLQVHHPSYYGWYAWYLRAHCRNHAQRRK